MASLAVQDEEIGGPRGAAGLAARIQEIYGKDGVALIVDEGFTGVDEAFGVEIASLGIAEKGAVNLELEVATLGGHSSVPPKHTSIGLLALLIAQLEEHPFEPAFHPESPYLQYLQCGADFGPEMPKDLKRRLKDPKAWPKLARELADEDRIVAAFLATTQSVDLISGGVKINAIPERASATANYRIEFTSSVQETVDHVVGVLRPIIEKLNLTFEAPGEQLSSKTVDVVRLTVGNPSEMGLEPAPLTPTSGPAFELVAGTTRHVFPKAIVAPSAMIGAFSTALNLCSKLLTSLCCHFSTAQPTPVRSIPFTPNLLRQLTPLFLSPSDTKHFWNSTQHIFRFLPAPLAQVKNFHTVDERIAVAGHLTVTAWYHKLLLNSRGWKAA